MTLKVEFICSFEIGDFADVKGSPKIESALIRCKDCKYFTRDTIAGVTIPGSEYCIFTANNRIDGDDFCSQAERKEE